jgi:hypothetical protein
MLQPSLRFLCFLLFLTAYLRITANGAMCCLTYEADIGARSFLSGRFCCHQLADKNVRAPVGNQPCPRLTVG